MINERLKNIVSEFDTYENMIAYCRAIAHNLYRTVASLHFVKYIFIFCACLAIFFDFLQSDWLQQRAAFYDILTVVQKCYFVATKFCLQISAI